MWVVGRIPYERIKYIDWEPDPNYGAPRFYVTYGWRRDPFREVVLYEDAGWRAISTKWPQDTWGKVAGRSNACVEGLVTPAIGGRNVERESGSSAEDNGDPPGCKRRICLRQRENRRLV